MAWRPCVARNERISVVAANPEASSLQQANQHAPPHTGTDPRLHSATAWMESYLTRVSATCGRAVTDGLPSHGCWAMDTVHVPSSSCCTVAPIDDEYGAMRPTATVNATLPVAL